MAKASEQKSIENDLQVDRLVEQGAKVSQSNPLEALKLLEEAEKLATKKEYDFGRFQVFHRRGELYINLGEYQQALTELNEALEISKPLDNQKYRAQILIELGNWYLKAIKEFDKAREHFEEAREIYERNKDLKGISQALNCMGIVEGITGNLQKSEDLFLKSFSLAKELGNQSTVVSCILNLGNISFHQKKYREALDHFQQAEHLYAELNNQFSVVACKGNIVACMEGLEGIDSALRHSHEHLKAASEIGDRDESLKALETISHYYKKKEDWKSFAEYYTRFHKMVEERKNEELQKAIAQIEMRQSISLKEKEVEIEKLRNVELKRALDDLKEAQEALVRKEKLATLGEIATRIAHEVQNPLNFINNFSDINQELVEDIMDQLQQVERTPQLDELFNQVTSNSKAIQLHGEKAANIVKELLERTWTRDENST